jgi:hypothetical protein
MRLIRRLITWVCMYQPIFDDSYQKRFNSFPYCIAAHNQICMHAEGSMYRACPTRALSR